MKKIMIGNARKEIVQKLGTWSVGAAIAESGFRQMVEMLRRIEPDISRQYSHQKEFNAYWELKMRSLHAFQCSLMLKAIEDLPSGRLTVVDIGDSSGAHMHYLRALLKGRTDIDTMSVNLDPVAVEKIKARGQEAILSRAEDIDLGERHVDLFTSFEMLEHLHNPTLFLRHLAKKLRCRRLLVTVPYVRKSRVGCYTVRDNLKEDVFAEGEHIFELSPGDWTLLMLHAGWRVVYSKTNYQYPRKWPLVSQLLLPPYWRRIDFEGFWGAILEKDLTFSDCYKDWQE